MGKRDSYKLILLIGLYLIRKDVESRNLSKVIFLMVSIIEGRNFIEKALLKFFIKFNFSILKLD